MNGLLVWSQSVCRSQMALYRAIGKEFGVPLHVAVWFYKKSPSYIDNRNAVGFSEEEFSDMTVFKVGEDWGKAKKVLDEHEGWHHFCCNSQWSAVFRRAQLTAYQRGMKTANGNESPCNMFDGWKRWAKEVYFRTLLPWKMRQVVRVSSFFVNYSGNDVANLWLAGWPKEKVIPFGYFPPPIPNTRCIRRTTNVPFEILITGEHTYHRGTDIAVEALAILKLRGIKYHATITQSGLQTEQLKLKVAKLKLPVDFVGRLPLEELNRLYETCTVFVGPGRHEPWGMRLNDALNCGAPLVVSRGMGGVKMVDDYGCGLAFRNDDADDLACQLERMATDRNLYNQCAIKAESCNRMCSPEAKALELATIVKERFPSWVK